MAFGNRFAGELIIVPGHRSLLSGLLFVRRAFRPASLRARRRRAQKRAAFDRRRSFGQDDCRGIVRFIERFEAYSFGRRQRGDEIEDALAHLGVADLGEGAIELQPLAGRQEVDDIGAGRRLRQHRLAGLGRRSALEEEGGRHFQHPRQLLQPAGADAVGALLVFLDLLERHVEGFAEPALAHADHQPPHAQPRADMLVDRVGRFRHRASSPQKAWSRALAQIRITQRKN